MTDRDRLLRRARLALLLSIGVLAAGCSTPSAGEDQEQRGVTLVTDESWELPGELRAAFERQSELRLVHRKVGRTPADLVDELAKHKGKPFGDVIAGIDTATAARALASGTLAPYTSPEANKGQQRFSVDKKQRLSAVDLLTVCVNIDDAWFAERGETPPERAADLTDPAYQRLLAVPSPQTTAEGTGFLLGSVAREGAEGWRPFWSKLKDNGVQILGSTADVRAAYTATGEKGDRPLVVGSATLPAQLSDGDESTTSVVDDSCHQQVRYAGVLAEANSEQRAGMLLDFLLTQQFQQAVPEASGTYPVREGVELPDGWDELAAQPAEATTLPARDADAGRNAWVEQWRATMAE